MGSKKLKKKKIKSKKSRKVRKVKVVKLKKTIKSEFDKKDIFQNKNASDQTLFKSYSRSCIGENYISRVKYFSKVREQYFSYLQTVVSDNCLYYNSLVTENILEKLSLQLEQHAILACLEIDIYEKSMTKIISDIKQSSEDKQMHSEIRKLLPEIRREKSNETIRKLSPEVRREKSNETIKKLSPEIRREKSNEKIKKLSPEVRREKSYEKIRKLSPEVRREKSYEKIRKLSPEVRREKSYEKIRKLSPEVRREKSYEKIKKLSPEVRREKSNEKTDVNPPESESYSKIPTISSTRRDTVNYNGDVWTEAAVYNSETVDSYYSGVNDYHDSASNIQSWEGNESFGGTQYCNEVQNNVYYNNDSEVLQTNSYGDVPLTVSQPSSVVESNHFSDQTAVVKPVSIVPPQSSEIDPLLASRHRLQKSVEQTFKQSDKLLKQKKDEKERAEIAQILEGDSSSDRFYDSLSDNEAKENIDDTNLMDRLEKMRELFGLEEENSPVAVTDKPKPKKAQVKGNLLGTQKPVILSRTQKPTIWKHEKVIQQYKFSRLSTEMSFERRWMNQRLFLELFGEDSDEENENEYLSEDKYRMSCTERISSWVVKYLMPFYRDKRIIGRRVFKTLGHHISDTIIDKIQYPDEWTVKYLVTKFFPHKKIYACDADVLNFQLD